MSERNETKAFNIPVWPETMTDVENLRRMIHQQNDLIRQKDEIIEGFQRDIDAMGRKCEVIARDRDHFEEHCIRRSKVEGDLEEQIAQYRKQQVILEDELKLVNDHHEVRMSEFHKLDFEHRQLKEEFALLEKQKEEQIGKYKQQNEQLTSAIFKQEEEVLALTKNNNAQGDNITHLIKLYDELRDENETIKANIEIEKFKAQCDMENSDFLFAQIENLADFITKEVEGEPSQSEGAVDCAIRVMRNRMNTIKIMNVKLAKIRHILG